jgi:hypothetical protein
MLPQRSGKRLPRVGPETQTLEKLRLRSADWVRGIEQVLPELVFLDLALICVRQFQG